MLYVIAVNARGELGASMLWRDDVEGTLLRIGEDSTSDLRLAGAGLAASDVWRESRNWRVRLPDGSVDDVRDGVQLVVGPWTVMLLLGNGEGDSAFANDDERQWLNSTFVGARLTRPWFEMDGRRLADVNDEIPMMLGGGDCCAVRIPWTREAVSAVIRRDGNRTRCYPFAWTTLARHGAPIVNPVVLADGDSLAVADAPSLRYADADEEIDRLLGVLRGEAPDGPPERPSRAVSTTERVASVLGSRPDAILSWWELAFGAGTVIVVLTQGAVTLARW